MEQAKHSIKSHIHQTITTSKNRTTELKEKKRKENPVLHRLSRRQTTTLTSVKVSRSVIL